MYLEHVLLAAEGHDLSPDYGSACVQGQDILDNGSALALHCDHAGDLNDRILLCLREMTLPELHMSVAALWMMDLASAKHEIIHHAIELLVQGDAIASDSFRLDKPRDGERGCMPKTHDSCQLLTAQFPVDCATA